MTEDDTTEIEATRADRRQLLTKGGAAAAIATVAGLSLGREARAANNDTILVGNSHTGTLTTSLSGSSLTVEDGNLSASIQAVKGSGASVQAIRGTNFSQDGGAIGVEGRAFGFSAVESVGVLGSDSTTNGAGVYGQHGPTFAGTGVRGKSDNGAGVSADGTTVDMRLDGTGAMEFAVETPLTVVSPGTPGTLARGSDGTLWFCTGTDTWRELTAAFPAFPVVSQFTSIEPYRAYDSRSAEPTPGRIVGGSNRSVSVAGARDLATGTVVTADRIPVGSTSIAYNITAIATTGVGFLSVTPGDASEFQASSVNWTGAGNIANAGIVKLDGNRSVKVFCGDGSAHFAIDVTGYWSPSA